MYLKLILCYVKNENQPEFTERQRAWNDIKDVEGLIFQLGGWNTADDEIACKLALWTNEHVYTEFHLNIHDTLARKAGHQHLYYKIQTDFFFPLSHDEVRGNPLQLVLAESKFVRIADCDVNPSYLDEFTDAQEKIWIPAMQQSKGMLGGFFSQHATQKNRFIVCSFWKDKLLHDEYAEKAVPVLRQKARVTQTINDIKGYYINLNPEWTAIGTIAKEFSTGF